MPTVLPSLCLAFNCRYDLDACDIQEKFPDLFQVHLEVEVEPRDRPSREAPPWERASMRGLNPKILFSSREEQQDVLSKFGKAFPLGAAGARALGEASCFWRRAGSFSDHAPTLSMAGKERRL